MRLAILVPPAEEGVDWRWAFDPQEAALRAGGIHVVEMPWTDPDGSDLDLSVDVFGIPRDRVVPGPFAAAAPGTRFLAAPGPARRR